MAPEINEDYVGIGMAATNVTNEAKLDEISNYWCVGKTESDYAVGCMVIATY